MKEKGMGGACSTICRRILRTGFGWKTWGKETT